MVATSLVSGKGKTTRLYDMVSHFGLLFWDRDTQAYELNPMKIVLSHQYLRLISFDGLVSPFGTLPYLLKQS